jgi:hypothetical protein
MKHEVVDFGASLSLFLPPLTISHFSWQIPDVVKDKIYLTCTITYVVKNDPKQEAFKIPAAGVFHLLDAAEQEELGDEEGVIRKFEVYLDAQAVWGRMGEVKEGKWERIWNGSAEIVVGI